MLSCETKRKTLARRDRLPNAQGRTRGIREFRRAVNRGLCVAATIDSDQILRILDLGVAEMVVEYVSKAAK